MLEDKEMTNNPKIFISYSWSSPTHEERVLVLAERLMNHGVLVVLDKWDLKEGQDKYAFMEQAVTDDNISKVLLICDKAYTEKANARIGGVGDETIIISPELYGKARQEKFIPIIFEVDEDDKPYCPAYVKSRMYVDLSTEDNRYEEEYEKLLRNIFNKPTYRKPSLGSIPEWLENETVELAPLRDIIRQIKGYTGNNKAKADVLLRKFVDTFKDTLKGYDISNSEVTGELVVKTINKMKPIRDLYIDYLEALLLSGLMAPERIVNLFESTYNHVMSLGEGINSYSSHRFEHYDYILWEMLLCTTAFLYHYEIYEELHVVLNSTYFLRNSYFSHANVQPKTFMDFRKYFELIEKDYKPKSEKPNLLTLSGEILIGREYKPIITKDSLSFADVLLCQLSFVYDIGSDRSFRWFPTSYIYASETPNQWIMFRSKKHCEKLLPLFGIKTTEELKTLIVKSRIEREYKYDNCWDSCPSILSCIKVDDIGSLI